MEKFKITYTNLVESGNISYREKLNFSFTYQIEKYLTIFSVTAQQ